MRKGFIPLQEVRNKIYLKAKAEPEWRFWGLYTHICKVETLEKAYYMARKNNGSPGVDGVSFHDIEAIGVRNYILEPIFETDFQEGSFGFRPGCAKKAKKETSSHA